MTEKENFNTTPEEAKPSEAPSESHQSSQHEQGHHHSHSGHHHHHHHHHSSHRRHKKKHGSRGKENFKNFIKYNKHYLIYAALTLALVLCLVLLGSRMDEYGGEIPQNDPTDTSQVEEESTSSSTAPETEPADTSQVPEGDIFSDKIQVNVPIFADKVDIVTPVVEAYMKLDLNASVEDFYDQYKATAPRLDVSLPVNLEYELTGIPEGDCVQTVEFVVADNPNFQNPRIFKTQDSAGKAEFYNLKTGTQYYYCINFTFESGAATSVSGSFQTENGPRLLMVDGVRNIRDFGGWTTVDGLTIKQGLLYRGQELDGAVEPTYQITAEGLSTMLSVLGVKMDMDLRLPTDNPYGTDALGLGVKHEYYAAPMYGNALRGEENIEKMRRIFSDLANADNYPIYLHCTYGQDRTGTVCYLLGALLGVDAASLAKDYRLSALCYSCVSEEAFADFVVRVQALPGNTLSAKVEGYLLSIGVTQQEIASIRTIFLGN